MKQKIKTNENVTRRDFLKCTGTIIFVAGSGLYVKTPYGFADIGKMKASDFPASEGYLLVDSRKCQGCLSCMLACSLVHEGFESLSLARLQVMQNSFEAYPNDVTIEQCRQCVDPECVKACPEGALKISAEFGNVRMIDKSKCTGCGDCVEACPYTPSRSMVMSDDSHGGQKAGRKCDLCANAKFHWDESGGGPNGKQACVEICPVGAISFTNKIPVQTGDAGYEINLRDINWQKLGYPIA